MKIIDLLNKIANGEEVPKKVGFAGIIFEYDEDDQMYSNDEHKNICDYVFLNDEVKIIEEEKKMPEKLDEIAYAEGEIAYSWSKNETILKDKINEIIDYFYSKGDE